MTSTVTPMGITVHLHGEQPRVSAILNVQNFLNSSSGVLLSVATWCQISLLLGYPQSAVLRVLHSALFTAWSTA